MCRFIQIPFCGLATLDKPHWGWYSTGLQFTQSTCVCEHGHIAWGVAPYKNQACQTLATQGNICCHRPPCLLKRLGLGVGAQTCIDVLQRKCPISSNQLEDFRPLPNGHRLLSFNCLQVLWMFQNEKSNCVCNVASFDAPLNKHVCFLHFDFVCCAQPWETAWPHSCPEWLWPRMLSELKTCSTKCIAWW